MIKRFSENDELFAYVFISVLSVNHYTLEKTWSAKDLLKKEGLFDPAGLAALAREEIARLLKASGCDRGEFMTDLFSSRLKSVAEYMLAVGLEKVRTVLRDGNAGDVKALLLPAKGVGPVVIDNFLVLRDH